MRFLFFAIAIILQLASYSQSKPYDLDSLRRANDSLKSVLQANQEHYNKVQDSIYKVEVKKDIDQMSNNTIAFVKNRDKEEKKKAFRYLLIGMGFLVILIIGLLRRRKKPENKV